MTLELPEWMMNEDFSWLTEDYILLNGKYPYSPDLIDTLEENHRYAEFPFGKISLISTDEIEAGDILVFFDIGDDVFYRFTDNDISEYRNKERDFLSHGVILKPPVVSDDGDEM